MRSVGPKTPWDGTSCAGGTARPGLRRCSRAGGWSLILGNLLLCTLFPFFALWYGPKYVTRHEYLKAFVCVAVPLVLLGAFVLV